MASITPNPKKRSYLLPPGCKDLIDVLNADVLNAVAAERALAPKIRVNGQIRAPELRVIDEDGEVGLMPVSEALSLARSRGVDLVETEPNARPPVCWLVDFGQVCYEYAKLRRKTP